MKRWLFFVCMLLLAVPALAHVGYVVDEQDLTENAGMDAAYLASPLSNPFYLFLMGMTPIIVILLYYLLPAHAGIKARITRLKKEAETYSDLIPWMARLGLGIALIGAGSAHVLISPIEPTAQLIATAQILLGFLLMAGFLTGVACWAAVLLYIVGLLSNFYLLGNVDFLALALAVIVLGNSKPGIDDLLSIPIILNLRKYKAYAPLLLRIGIGCAMIFLALYEKLLNPHFSRIVVEMYGLQAAVPVSAAMWVLGAGVVELAIGIALLLGWQTRFFAAIAFVVLSMSFFYFDEAVFSHITLFTTLSMLFVTGGGKWSIDKETA